MCLIIDPNTIPSVFDPSTKQHDQFVPVLHWIADGRGCMVYGGTKYRVEFKENMGRYFRLIGEFRRQGKVKEVLPPERVDRYAAQLKVKVPAKKFDDEHIVAIVALSGCRVVCTGDKASHPYLQRQDLYPKGIKPPKIYSAAIHIKLCSDENIVAICRRKK
jgi:hypothetical protein